MTHQQLEQAVADATGESLREIRRRGFNLTHLEQEAAEFDCEARRPLIFDWDEHDARRLAVVR